MNIVNKKIYQTFSLPGGCALAAIALAPASINQFFDHNHTCGLLNISALHVQYGIQAFAKFKRPECTRLPLRELQSQKFSYALKTPQKSAPFAVLMGAIIAILPLYTISLDPLYHKIVCPPLIGTILRTQKVGQSEYISGHKGSLILKLPHIITQKRPRFPRCYEEMEDERSACITWSNKDTQKNGSYWRWNGMYHITEIIHKIMLGEMVSQVFERTFCSYFCDEVIKCCNTSYTPGVELYGEATGREGKYPHG